MRPFDRLLCVAAGLWGVGAFVFGLRNGSGPALVLGIAALVVGLATASLVAWRPRA